jgi:glycosyltransferase involved in cell wall biosynthesis
LLIPASGSSRAGAGFAVQGVAREAVSVNLSRADGTVKSRSKSGALEKPCRLAEGSSAIVTGKGPGDVVTENAEVRIGAVIPTYRHVDRLGEIATELRRIGLPVLIVDDGNEPVIAARIQALHDPLGGIEVERRGQNGGKGAAVKTGLAGAQARGWTHALQCDADGQHDLGKAPELIRLARENPKAVICGVPVYDASIPKSRKIGRNITHFWVWVEIMGGEIKDSMCGFRVYPVAETNAVIGREIMGDRMDFDTEILVQLNWRGLRTVETQVKVTYPEGNVSNFEMWKDNVRISLMHTRLALQAPVRVPIRMWRRANGMV